jgi:hypothetical protein
MNKLFKYLTLGVVFFAFMACESNLDIAPFDIIDEEAAFETVADLESGTLGVYGSISITGTIDLNTKISDNIRIAVETNTGQGRQMFNLAYVTGTGEISGLWADSYQVIDRANRVLAATERITGDTPAEQALVQRIRGEMIAMRAWQHFDLYRNFVDFDDPNALAVPYMLRSEIGSPARLPKAEFFTLLNEDIAEAERLLPADFTSQSNMTLAAVEGLKARLALYTGDWSTAIDYATRVINKVEITDADNFLSLWDDSNEGEVIFRLKSLTVADGTIGIWERSTNPDVFFFASFDIQDQYDETNDIRFQAYFDGPNVKKYNWREGEKNLADTKLMRVSEMYLIRAEAYAQNGDLINAQADINTLLSNRLIVPAPVTFTNQQQALQTIALERRKELVYEGHRYYDLKRTNQSLVRDSRDLDGAFDSAARLEAGNFRFVLPIPQDEIFANDNMTQNPGYN